ncbi:hypothetical protein HUW51_13815 [Adhaeribacter swui]|uniref:Uncharacterized protein n=1 Tax=Adhaeribacter swui TaxID=2086471 RepID=A0A7G7G9B0_9BACT|nr:hypothetical protein [Adhaeribacter swui]QNF33744.1 hypothetical protein HUW51_13815 [Adhaeribacter swui]
MKKLSSLFFLSFITLTLFAFSLQAQTTPGDYFVGTWNVKAFGLPDGDKDLVIMIEKKDGKLSGGFVDPTSNKVANPFTSVSQQGNKLQVNFIAPEQQMDVYMTLEKKDDTNVTGSIMDMFNVQGTKAK